ncbi:family 43 glycosylhydrolase [Aestuariibaculum suncheonense]|uniref:Family 43 glycosylhydrolase n=1 Tax=Aestuariibaculum suncheonense TaxID=1028745 RepID=A0A8J6Q5M6_9FLAO|nr:family 43 glycosylhydrolase [Aestuariibaculum suncheonense]MBD0834175.1 family 43 glycosylhydrolase [Aestuariibaculum suncheonense]
MKFKLLCLILLLIICSICGAQKPKSTQAGIADKPLFRDPVFDGAADPSILWNKIDKVWYMYYTNRRAKDTTLSGVAWVHGTKIGIAESKDGAHWTYKGTCNIDYDIENVTHWAPDVLEYDGIYHMYLTIVPGIFEDWYHPRYIVHLTSKNMVDWVFQSKLELASERCIDADVFRLPNGTWRMYYNNENDGKSIYYADSKDLYNWVDSGKKVVKDRGEGPNVFHWKGKNWMVNDAWRGLGVYWSDDFEHWNRQEKNILEIPGTGEGDRVKGGHPDIVVNRDKAYVFYFTHPGRTQENKGKDAYKTRKTCIQVAELKCVNGEIVCDRNAPVYINLNTN